MTYNPNMDEKAIYQQVLRELKMYEDMRRQALSIKTIKDLFENAMHEKDFSTMLLIEFLWREKKTITMEDPVSVLDLYFKPKHRERMSQLLREYEESGKAVITLSAKAS